MHFNAKWLKNGQKLAKTGKNWQKIRAPPIRECPYTLLYIVAAKNRNHAC